MMYDFEMMVPLIDELMMFPEALKVAEMCSRMSMKSSLVVRVTARLVEEESLVFLLLHGASFLLLGLTTSTAWDFTKFLTLFKIIRKLKN